MFLLLHPSSTDPYLHGPAARHVWTDVMMAWFLVTGCILGITHLPWSWVTQYRGLLAAALFLYIPLLVLRLRHQAFSPYIKHIHFLRRSLVAYAVACGVVFPFCALGYYLVWRYRLCGVLHLSPQLVRCPGSGPYVMSQYEAALTVVNALFVAALPEEFFFRGFVQTWLYQVMGPYKAIGATSVLFALGHWIVLGHVDALLVFFPSLLFGLLRLYTGSILAGVLFHGSCNLLVHFLHAWFSS